MTGISMKLDPKKFNETEDLKPCPFCGGHAELLSFLPSENTLSCEATYSVRCIVCGALTDDYDTGEDAILAWNLRKEQSR